MFGNGILKATYFLRQQLGLGDKDATTGTEPVIIWVGHTLDGDIDAIIKSTGFDPIGNVDIPLLGAYDLRYTLVMELSESARRNDTNGGLFLVTGRR
ncbi:MAG: hypothetical protein Q9194_007457 [Teloschistes cf. exilis]